MRGITVAEFVGREMWIETGKGEIFFKAELQVARGNRLEFFCAGKEDWGLAARWLRQHRPIAFDGVESGFADRDQTFFFSFAADADEAFARVEVGGDETAEFADTEAAGVDSLEDGDIAVAADGGRFAGGLIFAGWGQQFEWGGEEIGHLSSRKEFGETLFGFWQSEIPRCESGPPIPRVSKPV